MHGYVPGERFHKILHDLAADGHGTVFTAICLLADYLDEHRSPIDYDCRRVRVDPDAVLTLTDWRRLSDRTVVHRGRDRRLRAARRYLYQLLTGADLTLSSCPLAYRDSTDRAGFLAFTTSLTIPLREALHEHAATYLRCLAIDEPLTWEPPAELCAGLRLPGCDPASSDRQTARDLVSKGVAVSTWHAS